MSTQYACRMKQSSHFTFLFGKMICLLTLMILFSLGTSNGEAKIVDFSHDLILIFCPPDIICNSKNLKKKVYIGQGEMYQFSYNPSDGKVNCKVKYTVSFQCMTVWLLVIKYKYFPGLPHLFDDQHLLRVPGGPLWPWQPCHDGQVRHHTLCLSWVTMTQWTSFYAFCNACNTLGFATGPSRAFHRSVFCGFISMSVKLIRDQKCTALYSAAK